MITKARITGREVAAGVMIGMNATGTAVGETGTIVAEAEAVVPVLITRGVEGDAMMMSAVVPVLITRAVEGGAMMMSAVVETEADQ